MSALTEFVLVVGNAVVLIMAMAVCFIGRRKSWHDGYKAGKVEALKKLVEEARSKTPKGVHRADDPG